MNFAATANLCSSCKLSMLPKYYYAPISSISAKDYLHLKFIEHEVMVLLLQLPLLLLVVIEGVH